MAARSLNKELAVKKIYGFIWHVVTDVQMASEGTAGADCRAFEAKSEDELSAKTTMCVFLQRCAYACDQEGCDHTVIVTDELTPKMIMGGMTANTRKLTVPTNKRELTLRLMSALTSIPTEKLAEVLGSLPEDVRNFLKDNAPAEATEKEIASFSLGNDFPKKYPRIKLKLGAHRLQVVK